MTIDHQRAGPNLRDRAKRSIRRPGVEPRPSKGDDERINGLKGMKAGVGRHAKGDAMRSHPAPVHCLEEVSRSRTDRNGGLTPKGRPSGRRGGRGRPQEASFLAVRHCIWPRESLFGFRHSAPGYKRSQDAVSIASSTQVRARQSIANELFVDEAFESEASTNGSPAPDRRSTRGSSIENKAFSVTRSKNGSRNVVAMRGHFACGSSSVSTSCTGVDQAGAAYEETSSSALNASTAIAGAFVAAVATAKASSGAML